MPKLRIIVTRNMALIDDVFREMEGDKFLQKAQTKLFRAIYLSRLKLLYNLISKKISGYLVKSTETQLIAEEIGSAEYIDEQKRKLRKFLDAGEDEILIDKEIEPFLHERVVNRVLHFLKQRGSKLRNQAVNRALGGNTVLSFFQRCGLEIEWEVIADNP